MKRPGRRTLWIAAGATLASLALLTACATAHLRPIPPRGPVPASAQISIQSVPVKTMRSFFFSVLASFIAEA